jgi:hypothetical protein
MALRTRIFYVVLFCLVILDSFLLSKPNLLGKIGLLIYKYHYLRSFPRTLLTVSCVIGVALIISWIIEFLVTRSKLSKRAGMLILGFFVVMAVAIFFKTMVDFSAWSFSHTGKKFRYGAYLLPILLVVIFAFFMFQIQLNTALRNTKEILPAPDSNEPSDVNN